MQNAKHLKNHKIKIIKTYNKRLIKTEWENYIHQKGFQKIYVKLY